MSNSFLDGNFPEQQVVLENAHCVFVRTPQPALEDSGLIVTRALCETVFDLTPEEWAATYNLLQEVKVYLEKMLRPDSYNVVWNVGPVGGQSIPHVHLHVIPRFKDEPLSGRGIRYYLKQPGKKRP